MTTIRLAFTESADRHGAPRDVVGTLGERQVAATPSVDRCPPSVAISHLMCPRVPLLCDLAREPGAETTSFTKRIFAHRIHRAGEANETQGRSRARRIDLWN